VSGSVDAAGAAIRRVRKRSLGSSGWRITIQPGDSPTWYAWTDAREACCAPEAEGFDVTPEELVLGG
jgi:hypothetical protein